eukprot:6327607-Pyramimonas_sp.AAC.1
MSPCKWQPATRDAIAHQADVHQGPPQPQLRSRARATPGRRGWLPKRSAALRWQTAPKQVSQKQAPPLHTRLRWRRQGSSKTEHL